MFKIILYVTFIFFNLSYNLFGNNLEEINPIVVTGNTLPKTLKETGSAITIITSEEIKEKNVNFLSQILSGEPGFQVYNSGGPHTLSRAFLRGNETDHSLVLINGMKIVDPATGRGSVDLERITLHSIDRIELLRGSQSALYGSEAIGGVINIILKRGTKIPYNSSYIEISSRQDKKFNSEISGNFKDLYFSASYQHMEGPGISAAEKSLGYEENDSYNIDSSIFTLDYDINSTTELSLMSRVYTSEIQEDDAPLGPIYDAEMHTNLLDWQSSIKLQKHFPLYTLSISTSTAKARRYQLKNDRKFRWYIADLNIGKINFDVPLSKFENFSFGTETERSHMDTQDEWNAYDFRVSSTSNYFSYTNNYFKNLHIDSSLRANKHDTFGSSATYRIAASYILFDTGLRIHSSYGTGYRAPTLDELYGSYGSTSVKEENSRSRDIGIEYTNRNNNFIADITFFSTQIDNLIGYGAAPGYKFENQGSAHNQGIELALKYIIDNNLRINSKYNYLTTNNNGKSLSRRRKHSGNTSINWKPDFIKNISINTSIEYHSGARDDAFTGGHISGYALMHSNLNYQIAETKSLKLKMENILDQKYSLADTAGSYGRTLSLGISIEY
ncbi:MAG: hypothetical protein CMJ14_04540 [Pelagibacterales bacterium]|nr:hypothetical protein [Pelagibacterales bacterium]